MRLPDVPDLLAEECEFPAERDQLLTAVGDVSLEAPNGEAVDLATVLELTDESTYRSVDEAYHALSANLGDAFVGRKHYDDRSRTISRDGSDPLSL